MCLPLRDVTYVVGASCQEIAKIRGFDYMIGMGGAQNVCGVFDSKNFIVYSGGLGQNYLHELVHVANAYYPRSHYVFLEGAACVLGGHFGQPLVYHARRLAAHFEKNSIKEFYPLKHNTLDDLTDPNRVIMGLLCKKILEKGGIGLLKKAMEYGTTSDDFYSAIDDLLGIKKDELPRYVVVALYKWVNEAE